MRKVFFDIVTLNSKRKACKGYEYERNDIYHLPLWLSGIYDEIQERCVKTLKEDSDAYGRILNETSQLLWKR